MLMMMRRADGGGGSGYHTILNDQWFSPKTNLSIIVGNGGNGSNTQSSSAYGQNGGATSINIDTVSITANGGNGGWSGWWDQQGDQPQAGGIGQYNGGGRWGYVGQSGYTPRAYASGGSYGSAGNGQGNVWDYTEPTPIGLGFNNTAVVNWVNGFNCKAPQGPGAGGSCGVDNANHAGLDGGAGWVNLFYKVTL
ncbi:hypothetical protein NO1_0271 [Candidatus Termititenax aidoneus]|uniref:Glycine-rich domain-containing protein n=1 Tax=Termititenax aidoneus TaxID=2218524 RepID=A0A388T9C5_TERA1|nr:hypothetical protein NO1_0271 [Candidatus Termititenax aidoneus]